MPYGCHIYAKAYDIAKATMCSYSKSDHSLPHWKFVLKCCAKCPSIHLPDQETYDQYPDTSPSIRFHIYHMIAHCTKHARLPLTDRKIWHKCQQDTTKIYTRKELVMMEIYYSNSEVGVSHSTCTNNWYESLW